MPLDLSDDEVRGYLRTGESPAPMLDLIGMMAAHAAVAGMRLGVFDALADGPRTAADLAASLPADRSALGLLLDTLVGVGYLEERGDGYANRPAADNWLRSDAPGGYGRVMELWLAFVTELWGGLSTSVRTGTPGADFYGWLGGRPELLDSFQSLQRGLAAWLAEEVVALAPVPDGAHDLLDLGGGHGWFSVAFCRRYPGLTATVVDLPEAVPVGAATVAAEGLADRITLRGADLATGATGSGHDVVLLFNVVHGFPAGTARDLVEKAVAALRPGGTLLLLETTPQPRGGVADTAFTRCFGLNLFHTQGGQVYPLSTLTEWMVSAGCTEPERYGLKRSTSHVLLAARRGPAGR